MMHKSLKDVLRACRLDLKKHLNKREKWVREWPGQMIITASQIQWTADCEKALDRGDKRGLKSIRKKQVWGGREGEGGREEGGGGKGGRGEGEGGREGGRERGREGGRERGREGGREGGRKEAEII